MDALVRDIHRDGATRGVTQSVAARSLGDCSTPAHWRAEANRVGIAAALAPLVHDPTLETDRALDRLCTVFDAYQRTYVCKHRLDQ
jgi:hypothetical protein